MLHKRAISVPVLLLACGLFCTNRTTGQVPEEFVGLYNQLDQQLTSFLEKIPSPRPHSSLKSASLLTVNAHVGELMMSDAWMKTHHLFLDQLKRLGTKGIVLEVSYPILTDRFHSTDKYLAFYKKISESIRERDMKVIVKHNTLLPAYTKMPVKSYYKSLDKSKFGKERYIEAAKIVSELRPEYLSLVGEPGTHEDAVGIKLTEREWVGYVALVVDRLRQDIPQHKTLLGAGAGTWESPLYFEGYARIKNLDYVDLHIYPLSNGFQDYLKRGLDWSQRVRQIDPSKKVAIGEAWLYKASARELRQIATNKKIFSRDVYSFWSPLDQKFLQVLNLMAQSERMDFYAPFWSRYFFAYIEAGPQNRPPIDPDAVMEYANKAAYQALMRGTKTKTGACFQALR